MKKLFTLGLLAILLSSGAFAQLYVGASGALHMDEKLTAAQISERFQNGDGIFYGPFAEIIFGHLGVGLAANFSVYERDVYAYNFTTLTYDTLLAEKLVDYDVVLYASYHLFKDKPFLDPFGELGFGMLATDFASDASKTAYNPFEDSPLMASSYWYAGMGLGINLGGLGIFGKFSFNQPVFDPVTATYRADLGGGEVMLDPYGYDWWLFPDGYLPKFRFTLGAKIALD